MSITRQALVVAFALLFACAAAGQESAPTAASVPDGTFVVVAPASFHEALAPFIAARRAAMNTELWSLEKVLAERDGADDPEKLKRALYDAWKMRHVQWVLLVGDADVLPVRYMVLDRVTTEAFDCAFYPSDLYYADLTAADGSFESWNGAHDGFHAGYFGEVRGEKNKTDPINYDGIDYVPELAVGRWPVSTPADVTSVVEKTLAHDAAVVAGEAWLDRAALFHVGGWVDARHQLDAMAKRLAPVLSVERRFFADDPAHPPTPPPTEAELLKLLASGVGFVGHAGHGNDDCWAECFSTHSIKKIAASPKLPVMMSAGCSTARFATLPPYEPYVDVAGVEHRGTNAGEVFTAPPPPPAPYQRGRYNLTGLGETLLRTPHAGAVAYIGCNTGSQPCGLTLLDGFVTARAAAHRRRLGDCWRAAVASYVTAEHLRDLKPTPDWYPPSIFFQGMKFMLFGDPTLLM